MVAKFANEAGHTVIIDGATPETDITAGANTRYMEPLTSLRVPASNVSNHVASLALFRIFVQIKSNPTVTLF